VLARRAASIGRREQLASWLYGVAVRTAKEARRRAARERAVERRLMDISKVESESPEDRDVRLPLLDEELNRLPRRYRAALVACELEGKSRREAAQQLGIPEGTLSAHLARGRKLLRERLLRRGVTLGLGPIAGPSRPALETAVPDRLMGSTVRAALGHTVGAGTTEAVSVAVSSLAERVLKMLFLARLTLIVVALTTAAAGMMMAVAFGLTTTAAESPRVDPPKAGPDDLAGRVVDKAGAGVADVQVWAMDGPWRTPKTVATTTTDARGRFVVPWPRDRRDQRGPDEFRLFARSRDGRVGWRSPARRRRANLEEGEIELQSGSARNRQPCSGRRPPRTARS
jgi:RNA polymerase sigma factor (sigma-70 family)